MQRTPRREHERAATADEAESESQRSTDVSEFINIFFAAQAGQLPFAGCTI